MSAIVRAATSLLALGVLACGGGSPGAGSDAGDDMTGADGAPGAPDGAPGRADARPVHPADAAGPAADAAPAGCVWNPTPVSTTMWTARSNLALAVAPSGERAVMFTADADLLYHDVFVARDPSGSFTVTPYGLALYGWGDYEHLAGAFTPSGALRIAYSHRDSSDANDRNLYYSTGPGAAALVDAGGPFGYADDPAVAVGPDGAPRIAYYVHNMFGADDRIVVATPSAGSFALEEAIVQPHLWGDTLFTIDAGGNGHVASICLPDGAHVGMTYAHHTASGWTAPSTVLIADGTWGGSSIAPMPGGGAHVVVIGGSSLADITGAPGAWSTSTIPYAANAIDPYALLLYTTIDAAGGIHAAWGDAAGTLWYERVGGPPAEVFASGQRIRDAAIALGPDGPVIAFAVGSADSWDTPVQIYVANCE